jgi:hypothetical protein
MVPSTPAQVGALEVGALAALDLLHVGHEQALAFALLYHTLQVIPLIAVGLIFELRLVLGREDQGTPEPGPTSVPTVPTVPVVPGGPPPGVTPIGNEACATPAVGEPGAIVPHPPP